MNMNSILFKKELREKYKVIRKRTYNKIKTDASKIVSNYAFKIIQMFKSRNYTPFDKTYTDYSVKNNNDGLGEWTNYSLYFCFNKLCCARSGLAEVRTWLQSNINGRIYSFGF